MQLDLISTTESDAEREAEVMRMRAWMLWEEIGHGYLMSDAAAKAAARQSRALTTATWVLAGATVVLALATLGLWLFGGD